MKNTRERKMVFSNVKSNKKKADEKSASNSNEIFDYNNEIVIGLKVLPEPKIDKKQNNKSIKSNKVKDDELDIPFQKETQKVNKNNVHKKKKKNKKLIFKITKWTTLLLVLIGGLICFLLSPVFNIKNINVYGNSKISTETIVSLSGISIDENMFKIRKADVINKIKQNAYIETVEITKKMSNTVEIEVKERTTTFLINIGQGYVYINNQGYILEVSSEKLELPIISGYITANADLIPGNRLNNDDLENLEVVLKIRDTAKSNEILNLITEIDISDEDNYKIIFGNDDKVAYLGDGTNLSTKMLYVKAMLEQEQGKPGEIFVNIDLNTEYPFFRERV